MHNWKCYRTAVIFLGCLFSTLCAVAQPKLSKSDSFIRSIGVLKTDTDKVNALLSHAETLDCADSVLFFDCVNEALNLSERVKWAKGIFRSNTFLGHKLRNCSKKYQEAITYFEKAHEQAITSHNVDDQAFALTQIGFCYQATAQYANALSCFERILEIKTNPDSRIGIFGNIGEVYSKIGDYAQAFTFYDSSLKTLDEYIRAKKHGDVYDSVQRASLIINLGDIYVSMSRYEKALEYYHRILNVKLSDKMLQWGVHVRALCGIANTYKTEKEYPESIEFYKQALDECQNSPMESDKATICYKLGSAYLEANDIDQALEYENKALAIADKNSLSDQLPSIYTVLGRIYNARQEYDRAVEFLQKAIDISKGSSSMVDEKDAWEGLSLTYEQMKEPWKALDAYKNFISLRDSVYNISKANALTRKDLQFEYDRQKKELAAETQLKMQKQKVLTYTGYFGLIVVLLLSFFIYRNYSLQKKANEIIKNEKQVSENLLLNILPVDTANELKASGTVTAKLFENVTVLFTDFVNFTQAGENMSPEELVAELHSCFKAFDGIIGKYKIEKIKTVGDAYIAVSGLPYPNTSHAADIVNAALEFSHFMSERQRQLGNRTFGMRIGINSGAVVAGIVGVKKFAYDIWGDAVNTAARVEQNCDAGKVNISETTYSLVKEGFNCEFRGEIEAKNKGMLKMYYVLSAK